METTIHYIRRHLNTLYPKNETESFIKVILANVCGLSSTDIIVYKNSKLSPTQVHEIESVVARLEKNEPIQYIFGKTEFCNLMFKTAPGVLIPRPETEELVMLIHKENQGKSGTLLDIGTGSGCIAVTLAKLLPHMKVQAWDVSPEALAIACENSKQNGVSVDFRQQDLFSAEVSDRAEPFDIMVSNPPYVCESERTEMEQNVLEYEPSLALFVPDTDPLRFYCAIAALGVERLNLNGRLYVEINSRFGEETVHMLESFGYRNIKINKDISGRDRMISATR